MNSLKKHPDYYAPHLDMDITNRERLESWFITDLEWRISWKMRRAIRLSSRVAYRLVTLKHPNEPPIYDLT